MGNVRLSHFFRGSELEMRPYISRGESAGPISTYFIKIGPELSRIF